MPIYKSCLIIKQSLEQSLHLWLYVVLYLESTMLLVIRNEIMILIYGKILIMSFSLATVPKTMRPEYKEARKAYDLAQNQNPISRFQK